jgi:AhpD family alkylhydroperoxidase
MMKPFTKGLDTETQLLVAVGSAVAAGCIPCLESITGMAAAEGIDKKKLRAAAIIGQFIKDQPAGQMKQSADELLGTHLSAAGAAALCPLESGATAGRPVEAKPATTTGCGCR